MHRFVQRRSFSIESVSKTAITIAGLGPKPVSFRHFFLRDGSQSPEAVDPNTRQKTFNTGSLNADVRPNFAVVDNNSLVVDWSDGHRSVYSKEWLERYSSAEATVDYRRLQEWKPLSGDSKVQKVEYKDYIKGHGAGYKEALEALNEYGLLQITGIPHGEGTPRPTVESIAAVIGEFPRQTFYGTSWNVKSVQQPRNVAYTSVYLPLHMDLLYYESPPGLQFLHVVENSTTGGESIFADSYAAAIDVSANDPEAYQAICEVPLTYHYENDGRHYFQMRPMIVESKYGKIDKNTGRPFIDHLNYSPPFQGPLDAVRDISDAKLDAFLRGLKRFEAFIGDPRNQLEFRMNPGTCIVFHNRRVLHARREFDASSGSRWFKGTYVDIDAFYSALRTFTKKKNN
ncbi:Gamma-butyrobetaine dioxygenase [Wickerhamiella sorbophila]|uniref:Gamma-butyrobetaine dioxygenase n=1 Tax=Wickerhamiella sorbophila TaxID=45607 RepID=A0A2T0FEZ7_9ASCO|nr:Gamma-butyrobetaine dioxygenase [Wickerhamiella sorbophila]PRT53539.1 Gamma-butyrobetaine dioxygenase [Wickerhamiella sorbophila]